MQASLIESLFHGLTQTCTTCIHGHESVTPPEIFKDIHVPVPAEATDLLSQLREMYQPERMDGNNQYQCDTCGCKVDADQVTRLCRLPPILAFQVNLARATQHPTPAS